MRSRGAGGRVYPGRCAAEIHRIFPRKREYSTLDHTFSDDGQCIFTAVLVDVYHDIRRLGYWDSSLGKKVNRVGRWQISFLSKDRSFPVWRTKFIPVNMLRTLGYLLESQVPLLEALIVTRPTIRNQYYRRFVDRIKDNVDQGGRFAQPFTDYPYIPETVKQMVAIGEEAGKLPFVMLRLSRFYDIEIEQELKKFAAMIEPAALIIMGGIVGVIVSSVILPLFKLSQALR